MPTPSKKTPRGVVFGRVFARRYAAAQVGVLDRAADEEVSKERLEAVQREIDSKLEKGLTFKSVHRASW